jgi:putative oxidoreductase
VEYQPEEETVSWLIRTNDAWSTLILRVALGAVMLPHGAQKLLGWFGGYGFAGTVDTFAQHLHIPPFLTFFVIMAESLGSLGLILGCLTRLGAFGIMCNMIGAIILVHRPYGFFMNWFGKQAGEGFEYHLLAIAIALVIVLSGGGKWSVDQLLTKNTNRTRYSTRRLA